MSIGCLTERRPVGHTSVKGSRDKVVYICSPHYASSDLEHESNVIITQNYGRLAIEQGFTPLIPHLYIPNLVGGDKGEARAKGLSMACALLRKCDVVWVCGDKITRGMRCEIEEANLNEIRIDYVNIGYKTILTKPLNPILARFIKLS